MDIYWYLSMTPEALVASMLPPEEFGKYLAIGTHQSTQGQAIFFDLELGEESEDFDLAYAREHCVPHSDGRPKHSLYIAIYRVLERMPLEALKSLWLATEKGKVLELKQTPSLPNFPGKYHLFQELCPVHPLVASSCAPAQFCRYITDSRRPFYVPKLCFLDLELAGLADDPEHAEPRNLYYPDHFIHLRECLLELQNAPHKCTKTIDRLHPACLPYHCIRHGVFVGDHEHVLYYPFPSRAELEGKYYYWWRRSAHSK